MSRFPELFEEAVEGVVEDDAFLVEDLAEHVARADRRAAGRAARRGADHARATRTSGTTPVTKLATQEMVSLIGIAAASRERVRRVVGVEATGINACPCAQGLVRGARRRPAARGGLRGRRRRADPRARPARDPQPARPGHAPRRHGASASTPSGSSRSSRASMSSPIYELLKRPDELFVVEHAHLQPRFVEDSVRVALKSVLDELPAARDDDFVLSRQVNFETIHAHEVVAERYGTIGELRVGARGRRPRPGRAHGPQGLAARVASLSPAPQLEAVLLAPREPPDVRAVEEGDRRRRQRRRTRSPATDSRTATPRARATRRPSSTRPTHSA